MFVPMQKVRPHSQNNIKVYLWKMWYWGINYNNFAHNRAQWQAPSWILMKGTLRSCGMCWCLLGWVVPDISKDHSASSFRVRVKQSFFFNYFIIKMKALQSFKTLGITSPKATSLWELQISHDDQLSFSTTPWEFLVLLNNWCVTEESALYSEMTDSFKTCHWTCNSCPFITLLEYTAFNMLCMGGVIHLTTL